MFFNPNFVARMKENLKNFGRGSARVSLCCFRPSPKSSALFKVRPRASIGHFILFGARNKRSKLTFGVKYLKMSSNVPLNSVAAMAVLLLYCFVSSLAVKDAQQLEGESKIVEEQRRCWGNQNGEEKAQWYSEGEQIESGTFVYECRDTKIVPIGCLDESGRKIGFKEIFVAKGLLMQCSLSRWGSEVQLKTIGCVLEGKQNKSVVPVGKNWADKESQTWWECAVEGTAVRARLGGCLDLESLSRLRIGESIDRGRTTFECQSKGADVVKMVAVGCVSSGGEHQRIGQQWQDGDFLFYCKRTAAGACEKSCVGCVLQGRRLYDGDRLQQKRTVFQCEIRPKRHALSPVACVSENGVERVIDCKWNDQSKDGTYRLKRHCVLREGRADIDTLGCVFEKDGVSRLTLKAGTFTIWREAMNISPLGVSCRRALVDGDEWPLLETFPASEVADRTNGLAEDIDPRI